MRIFMFRSGAQRELQAFTDEPSGNRLPGKFSPWSATGVIPADKDSPHLGLPSRVRSMNMGFSFGV
jgi:hypothetical protein